MTRPVLLPRHTRKKKRPLFEGTLDVHVAVVTRGHAPTAHQRGLEWHRLDVSHGQLAGDGDAAGCADGGPDQNLVV